VVRPLSLHPRSVVAVYAHPDDADVAAGGVLSLWASEGASIHMVVVCQGDKGSHSIGEDTNFLRATRHDEFEDAARIIGAQSAISLGFPDGSVTNDEYLRSELVGVLRTFTPDVVIGPDPTATFFGGVYVNHRDHREVGWALLDAVAPAAAMPLYFPEKGAPHQVGRLLLSGTHEPDVVVDIALSIEKKLAAVLAHASQLGGDDGAIRDVIFGRAEQAGRPVGVSYAEAFRSVEFAL
jgi:LmbE family N-acetylglucosaminyl deacetylase